MHSDHRLFRSGNGGEDRGASCREKRTDTKRQAKKHRWIRRVLRCTEPRLVRIQWPFTGSLTSGWPPVPPRQWTNGSHSYWGVLPCQAISSQEVRTCFRSTAGVCSSPLKLQTGSPCPNCEHLSETAATLGRISPVCNSSWPPHAKILRPRAGLLPLHHDTGHRSNEQLGTSS